MLMKLFKSRRTQTSGFDSEANEYVITDKNGKSYSVIHSIAAYSEDDIPYWGKYTVLTRRKKFAGYLKYVFRYDKEPPYMLLADICFEPKSRTIGLGSRLIRLFEENAKSLGAVRIEGELSDVDGEEGNKALRNNFYIKRGYEIVDDQIIKNLL